MSSLVLCSIVKNESKVLRRMLASCRQHVSYVVLSDTGSTDDTLAVAKQACTEFNMDSVVHKDVWRDFGHNRSLNLDHARAAVKAWGLDPMTTWFLLLDADMELEAKTAFPDNMGTTVALAQHTSHMSWMNTRLVRADSTGRYIMRTHEFFAFAGMQTISDWATIKDHCDGGSRADKLERDARLLRLDLKEDPRNARAMFYLGQTLQGLGKHVEALFWYDKRVVAGGFEEEVWMAAWESSRCAAAAGRLDTDHRAAVAWSMRPWRAESLSDIAHRAMDRSEHRRALATARAAGTIPFPSDEKLWVDEKSYKWVPSFVACVSAFYLGENRLGAQVSDYLRLTKGSPYREIALANASAYAQRIAGTHTQFPFTPEEGWHACNPSIVLKGGIYTAIVRTVNYTINPDGSYNYPGVVRTRSFAVRLDETMHPIGSPVELEQPPKEVEEALIVGFEDLRIVDLNDHELRAIGTRCDMSPTGIPEMWMGKWDLTTGKLIGAPGQCSYSKFPEKNWLPIGDGKFLYGHNPIAIVNPIGEVCETRTPTHDLSGFRGGAAPVPYLDGLLYVIHEVTVRPSEKKRTYLHRFVHAVNGDWGTLRISRPFLLNGKPGIEFCAGMAPSATGRGFVLVYGVEDNTAWYARVQPEAIEALMLAAAPIQG